MRHMLIETQYSVELTQTGEELHLSGLLGSYTFEDEAALKVFFHEQSLVDILELTDMRDSQAIQKYYLRTNGWGELQRHETKAALYKEISRDTKGAWEIQCLDADRNKTSSVYVLDNSSWFKSAFKEFTSRDSYLKALEAKEAHQGIVRKLMGLALGGVVVLGGGYAAHRYMNSASSENNGNSDELGLTQVGSEVVLASIVFEPSNSADCVRNVAVGTLASVVTKNPLPIMLAASSCLPTANAEHTHSLTKKDTVGSGTLKYGEEYDPLDHATKLIQATLEDGRLLKVYNDVVGNPVGQIVDVVNNIVLAPFSIPPGNGQIEEVIGLKNGNIAILRTASGGLIDTSEDGFSIAITNELGNNIVAPTVIAQVVNNNQIRPKIVSRNDGKEKIYFRA